MLLPLELPGGATAVMCVLLVRAPLLRCCLRCLRARVSQPGALLAAELSPGGALSKLYRDQGGIEGHPGRMYECFFWLTS